MRYKRCMTEMHKPNFPNALYNRALNDTIQLYRDHHNIQLAETKDPAMAQEINEIYSYLFGAVQQLRDELAHAKTRDEQHQTIEWGIRKAFQEMILCGLSDEADGLMNQFYKDWTTNYRTLAKQQAPEKISYARKIRKEEGDVFQRVKIFQSIAAESKQLLSEMVIAFQMRQNVSENECKKNIYALALQKYFDEYPSKYIAPDQVMNENTARIVSENAEDILVKLFEPYIHEECPVQPEMASMLIRAFTSDVQRRGPFVQPKHSNGQPIAIIPRLIPMPANDNGGAQERMSPRLRDIFYDGDCFKSTGATMDAVFAANPYFDQSMSAFLNAQLMIEQQMPEVNEGRGR